MTYAKLSGYACATATAAVLCACAAADRQRDMVLSLNDQPVTVEIADTETARSRGLAHRRTLDQDSGMLFVFQTPARYSMWMMDTHIALSVAFLDAQGVVINIEDMAPDSLATHVAERPAKYALELNRGWFDTRGVRPGLRVEGIENAPPGR